MILSLEPEKIQFKVGDKVFVNQPYNSMIGKDILTDNKPYFEAEIVRIFFEFPTIITVVSEPKEVHHFAITVVTYDLKPVGFYQDASRVTLRVDLTSKRKFLFATEDKLLSEE